MRKQYNFIVLNPLNRDGYSKLLKLQAGRELCLNDEEMVGRKSKKKRRGVPLRRKPPKKRPAKKEPRKSFYITTLSMPPEIIAYCDTLVRQSKRSAFVSMAIETIGKSLVRKYSNRKEKGRRVRGVRNKAYSFSLSFWAKEIYNRASPAFRAAFIADCIKRAPERVIERYRY